MLRTFPASIKTNLTLIAGTAFLALTMNCRAAPGAGTSAPDSKFSETQLSTERGDRTELAREWGLTGDEWQRYQTLMNGPRGVYSPGLDPLTALGIEARTSEERRRYAELQVKAERERVDKELAYQRAYDQAFAALYPAEKIIHITSNPMSPAPAVQPLIKAAARLAIFVKDNCPPCIARTKDLQATRQPFDLYFVGSQGEDIKIRRWALKAGIEPARVRTREITLNHDEGRWLSLAVGGELPAVVREVNGQWQRQ